MDEILVSWKEAFAKAMEGEDYLLAAVCIVASLKRIDAQNEIRYQPARDVNFIAELLAQLDRE